MRRSRLLLAALLVMPILAACGADPASGASSLTLYTCTSADVEQAVVQAFERANSGTKVDVFRAPTGQLNARIASDQRSGGLRADVIWACDPLTMHGYDSQGLLRAWSPPNAGEIPKSYRTADFTGVDVLYMVVALHQGAAGVRRWSDLTNADLGARVALPSPSFAASALGALGYLASAPGYGIDFYKRLKANGAVQVNSPTDTLTGVEQGMYSAGVTLASAAYADEKKGSPISVVWPKPGAIAIYAPIGVTAKKGLSPLAKKFADFVASRDAQAIVAAHGRYAAIPGLGGPPVPSGSPVVSPDWTTLFGNYQAVLAKYVAIFGG